VDSLKHTFYGSFELQDAIMAVDKNFTSYIGKVIHTMQPSKMITKGDGKDRTVNVPKMTTFRVDQAQRRPGTPYVTLALTEMESRRPYYRDVLFTHPDELAERDARLDDYFGYIFAMGEGAERQTSPEARAAIRQGRVILGMTEDEVTLAMGEEPNEIVQGSNGKHDWVYYRSKGKSLFVHFGRDGRVESYETGATTTKTTKPKKKTSKK
jgi:hypothetical protein